MNYQIEIKDDAGVWQDVSNNAYEILINSEGINGLDYAQVGLFSTIESTTGTIKKGKEARVGDGTNYFFGGQFDKISRQYGKLISAKIFSYGQVLLNQIINEVYYTTSPEDIVADLLTKYTDLTFSSTNLSGFTISKIVFKDKKLGEAIDILANLLDWVYYSDYDKKFYFEPKGLINSGLTFTVGDNVLGSLSWDRDPTQFCNHLLLQGDKQEFQTQQTFSGDGSTTDFVLNYKPSNVRVLAGGVEQKPIVEGATSGGSYEVDYDNKTISFISPPASGTDNVVVYYTYYVPIRIDVKDEDSISTYSTDVMKKISDKSIKTFADARDYARIFLNKYANPILTTTLNIKGFDKNLIVGRLVHIVDADNNVDDDFVIIKTSYDVMKNQTKIKVGTNDFLIWNWQAEVMNRLKQLESAGGDSDILQKYLIKINKVNVVVKYKKITIKTRPLGNMICLDRTYSSGVLDNSLLQLDYYSDDTTDGWSVYYTKTY